MSVNHETSSNHRRFFSPYCILSDRSSLVQYRRNALNRASIGCGLCWPFVLRLKNAQSDRLGIIHCSTIA